VLFILPGAHVRRLENTREVARARSYCPCFLAKTVRTSIPRVGALPLHTTTYLLDIEEEQEKNLYRCLHLPWDLRLCPCLCVM
jgi:hypothetical protein